MKQTPLIRCPRCGSSRTWRDGQRRTHEGPRQRFICRSCGRQFSNASKNEKPLYSSSSLLYTRRVCATEGEAKNLAAANTRMRKAAGEKTETNQATVQGKIVEHLWWLKKQGYAESTILTRGKSLRLLVRRGADLLDPESVKETIAKQETWTTSTKATVTNHYTVFLISQGLTWDPPRYKPVRRLPFVPLEEEVDALIAGCGRKTTAFLQLLKETGMRRGEAWLLLWTDLDNVNNTVRVTPEKGSNPRLFRVSDKCMAMLMAQPREGPRVFGTRTVKSFSGSFARQRRRIADKLQNPRIAKITFHTLRHYKGTMEYAKTKDILHVMQVLGHKNIKNTLIYVHLAKFKDPEEFTAMVAHSMEEACELVEAGFEYVCNVDGDQLFRKRR